MDSALPGLSGYRYLVYISISLFRVIGNIEPFEKQSDTLMRKPLANYSFLNIYIHTYRLSKGAYTDF